jgi:hypothetical protein
MFDRIRRFGKRKVSTYKAILVIMAFLIAGATIAATGSATVDFLGKTIYARTISALKSGSSLPYQLEIVRPQLTGVTKFTRDATVINSRLQLSTWSGQAAVSGQSYYQLEAGKRYIVDWPALYASGYGPITTGVTLMLPDATAANDEATVSVELVALTEYTNWAAQASGTSVVYVVPYSQALASASATTGYNWYDNRTQTLQVYTLAWGSGTTPILSAKALTKGGRFTILDSPGENATFGLKYNSMTSAYVINAYANN